MKANELRIGNYVWLELGLPSLDTHKIQPIDIYEIAIGHHAGDIKPIPLNDEWLIKLGFVHLELYLLFYKKHFQVDFNIFSWETPAGQSNGVPAGAFYMLINGVMVVLTYVHELQNLYFVLTSGTELCIV